jgi:hypothetical protein
MKRIAIAVMVLAILSGCTSSTPHGECIGLNGEEDPKLKYNYSAWNIGVGLVTISMIIPPIYVLLEQLKCPVGRKPATPTAPANQ